MASSRGVKRSASSTPFDLHHSPLKRTVKTENLDDELTETKLKVKPVKSIVIDLTEDTPPNSPGLNHAMARRRSSSSSDKDSGPRRDEKQKINNSTPAWPFHSGSDSFARPGSEVPDAYTRHCIHYDFATGDDAYKVQVFRPMIDLIRDSPSSRRLRRTLESKSGQKRALHEVMTAKSYDSAAEDRDYDGGEDDDGEDDDDQDDNGGDDDGEDDGSEDDESEDDEGEEKDVARPRIRKSKLTISSIWDTMDAARPDPVVIIVAGKRARKQSIAKYRSGDLVLGQYYTPKHHTPALLAGHEGLLTVSQKVANVLKNTRPGSRRMLKRLSGTGLSLLQICDLGGYKDHNENTLEQWGKDIGLDTADLPTRNNPLQCYMDAQSLLRLFEYRLSGFDWHPILKLFQLADVIMVMVIRDHFKRHLVKSNGLKLWKAAARHAQNSDKELTKKRVNDLFIVNRG